MCTAMGFLSHTSSIPACSRDLTILQVVDYTAYDSLYDFLSSASTAPGNRPFDAIFDCIGNDELYRRSPNYLKPDGTYINIEAGPFGIFKLNSWLPTILGGTPRTIKNIFSPPDRASAEEVVRWFEKGWVKEVPVDSTFEMDGVLQVGDSLGSSRDESYC